MSLSHEVHPGILQSLAPAANSCTRFFALASIAAVAFWNITTPARADEPGPANTQTARDAPAKSADTRVWQVPAPNIDPRTAAATTQQRPTADPRGALGWEIVGGVSPAVSGITLVMMAMRGGGGGGHVPSFRFNTPMLVFGALMTVLGPAAGVSIAGSATGGRGSMGYAYLGTAAGLPLSLPGMIGGAVIGYRLSAEQAPAPAPTCASDVRLQVDGTW